MCVYGFKMFVSFGLTVAFLAFDIFTGSDPMYFTAAVLWLVPLFVFLFIGTFAVCMFIMHFGVFIDDLANVVAVLLRLVFYMSGVFYSIGDKLDKLSPALAAVLSVGNPVALIISSIRDVMLYGQAPNVLALLIWLVVGVLVSVLGVSTIYKYENSYTKVI